MSMYKEYPMLTQVKITSDWKYLACKVFQDLKYKTGFKKMLAGTGTEFSKESNLKEEDSKS